MKELKDKELDAINGGNDGDTAQEAADSPNDVKFLHQIGDEVEVYNSSLHIGTKHTVILDRRTVYTYVGCTKRYVGEYYVKFDGGYCEWVLADKIQRD